MFTKDNAPKRGDAIWVEEHTPPNGTVVTRMFDNDGELDEIRVLFSDGTSDSYFDFNSLVWNEGAGGQWRIYK